MAAGADAGVFGAEDAVYAFDGGQVNANGTVDPLYGDWNALGAPENTAFKEHLAYGNATRLDAGEGYALPEQAQDFFDQDSWSLVMTVSVVDTSQRQFLIDNWGSEDRDTETDEDGGFSLHIDPGSRTWLNITEESGQRRVMALNPWPSETLCTPRQIAFVSNGPARTMTLLRDGAVLAVAPSIDVDADNLVGGTIGSKRDGEYAWRGRIDDVRFYSGIISGVQLDALRTSPYCESACTDVWAPDSRIGITGTTRMPGFYSTNVQLDMVSADAGAGVLVKRWDATGTWGNYTGPVTLTADGAYTIKFGATDQAENVAVNESVSFTIDKSPPTGLQWIRPAEGTVYPPDERININDEAILIGPTQSFHAEAQVTPDITHVIFYVDGFPIGTDFDAPFQVEATRALFPTAAVREAVAQFHDEAGNQAEVSIKFRWI